MHSQLSQDGDTDSPVYGLISDTDSAWASPVIRANRFGAEYGSHVWHVWVDYRGQGSEPGVTVHTVYRLTAPSALSDGWTAVIGLVGFDTACDTIGRIDPAPRNPQ
ncbi:MAG: hypothetical protein QOE89_1212 [Pseudonocardiales bacterium]|nr:hypothetical protein [Pseudonocardiales bacterium]